MGNETTVFSEDDNNDELEEVKEEKKGDNSDTLKARNALADASVAHQL